MQIERRPDADSSPKCLRSRATIPDADLFDFCAIYVAPREHPMNETCVSTPRSFPPRSTSSRFIRPKTASPLLVRNRASRPNDATHPCRGRQSQVRHFMYWLNEQNESGADIFLGMNPIKAQQLLPEPRKTSARFAMSISILTKTPQHLSRPFERRETFPLPISCSILLPKKIRSSGAWKDSIRTSRSPSCARWRRSFGATSRQPTYPAFCVCPDLQTESTTSNFWSARSRKRIRSTAFAIRGVRRLARCAAATCGDEHGLTRRAAIRAP